MSESDPILILTFLIGLIVVVWFAGNSWFGGAAEKFVDIVGLPFTAPKPILWFVVDDYGVNSRKWADFGARSSRDLNVGFVGITKARCDFTQGKEFEVRHLMGRDAVASVILSYHGIVPAAHRQAPHYLWRGWARAALLYYAGGLYLDGFSLCLGPSFWPHVKDLSMASFGTDHDERRTGGAAALAPASGPFAGWSAKPRQQGWSDLTFNLADLIQAGPQSWSSAQSRNQIASWHEKFIMPNMPTIRSAEWSRREDGRAIELEDILDRQMKYEWVPPSDAVYLPIDKDVLERSVTYKWFMNMSTEQIMNAESRFVWAQLAQRG